MKDLIGNIIQLTESKYCTQNSRYLLLLFLWYGVFCAKLIPFHWHGHKCVLKLRFWLFKIQTGYSLWGAASNRQLIYFWGVALITPPASNTRPEPIYYVGIILRIIGHNFGENNAGIIGCLQAE